MQNACHKHRRLVDTLFLATFAQYLQLKHTENMKKIVLLFCGILFAGVLTAQTRFTVGGLHYRSFARDSVEVYYNPEASGTVVIPALVTYNEQSYHVARIGFQAFRNCSALTSVVIPNSVTEIDVSAFQGTGLISVVIPNSVTKIDETAFYDCTSLTSVTIPNSVTWIGRGAFWGCTALTSITIPNSVTYFGTEVFVNCTALTSVSLSNNITSIPISTFNGCSALASVVIPDGIASIEASAFRNCVSLPSINIPNGVTEIGKNAFDSCIALTSVSLPNSLRKVNDYAFHNCSGMTSLSLGDSITRIEFCAFNTCSSLTSIVIPRSVEWFGNASFYHCTALNSVTLLSETPQSNGENAFRQRGTDCILWIPCGSTSAYRNWNYCFDHIQEASPYNLSVHSAEPASGTVEIGNGSDCYEKILTVFPTECSRFAAWNDGNTDNPRTITLSQDTAFTAHFENIVYTDTVSQTISAGTTFHFNGKDLDQTGIYNDTLQNIDGCDSIITLHLTVLSSLNEVSEHQIDLSLYPNPANTCVFLHIEGMKEPITVLLCDIQGRKIREYRLENAQAPLQIPLSDLPKGVYTLTVGKITKKLVVE